MPSIAQTPPGRIGSKKRRRDDDEGLQKARYVVSISFEPTVPARRSLTNDCSIHFTHHLEDPSIYTGSRETHWKSIAAKSIHQPSKRARVSSISLLHETMNGTPYGEPQYGHGASIGNDTTGDGMKGRKVDLRPCHICRRRPSDRAQLDRYADCEGCGARTCFVCMRQCEGNFWGFGVGEGLGLDVEGDFDCLAGSFEGRGSDFGGDSREEVNKGRESEDDGGGIWEKERFMGHRRKVCRECCVELGAEGEVRCLGCYRVGGLE